MKEPQPRDWVSVAMGKCTHGTVGQLVLPIWPGEQASTHPASLAEAVSPCASTGAGAREGGRKRKWYTLYDKVYREANLWRSYVQVEANGGAAGSDGVTIEHFQRQPRVRLKQLRRELREKRYRPRPVRRCWIPKAGGGQRPLGIPAVRDRIVQTALVRVLEPIFDAKFSEHSHGFRPGRGCQTALREVWEVLRDGAEWIVDADIKRFFDTVDHEVLMNAVREEIADGSVLRLVQMFLASGVMEETQVHMPQEGTPQGGPVSPLLANIYLHALDEALQAHGYRFVRYADDFVVLASTEQEAQEALRLIREVLGQLRLTLNEAKTRIVHISDGFEFLGFRHVRSRRGELHRVVRRTSQAAFKQAIRQRTRRHAGQRPRKAKACGLQRLRRDQRLRAMIAVVNQFTASWFGYFRQATRVGVEEFHRLDGFVRRRVRCAIAGRYVRGRWQATILPNSLLAALGVQSLEERFRAHVAATRPLSQRTTWV